MSLPSDADITEQVRVIIEEAFDNGTVAEFSKRTVRNMLNDHFGVDLESKKKFISAATQEQVNRITAEREKAASTSRSPSPAKASARASSAKTASSSSRSKPAPKRKQPVSEDSDGEEAEPSTSRGDEHDSDSGDAQDSDPADFSELEEDASTSRSRKKSKTTKAKSSSTTTKAAKSKAKATSSGGSEAEQRLARLKKLVIECGVRKPWKKLYEAADVSETDFAGQCTVVQGVLRELGMTGKGSVEQARKIRAEREFADELAALQENTVMSSDRGRPTRASRTKSTVVAISDDEATIASDESDFESAAPAPRTTKKTAARPTRDDADNSEDEGPTRSRSFKSSLASFAADLNSDSD